jgi:hypothetical protein
MTVERVTRIAIVLAAPVLATRFTALEITRRQVHLAQAMETVGAEFARMLARMAAVFRSVCRTRPILKRAGA